MEMCLAWHLPPHEVRGFPRAVQQEMLTFFRWKGEREAMLNRQTEFEHRAVQQQASASRTVGRR